MSLGAAFGHALVICFAAVFTGNKGIKQDRIGEIGLRRIDVLAVLDPDRLDRPCAHPPEGFAELGGFVAVQLDPVEKSLLGHIPDILDRGIDENADGIHKGRDFVEDVQGLGDSDVSWTLGIEIESQHVGAHIHRHQGVFQIGESADFDLDPHHGFVVVSVWLLDILTS